MVYDGVELGEGVFVEEGLEGSEGTCELREAFDLEEGALVEGSGVGGVAGGGGGAEDG